MRVRRGHPVAAASPPVLDGPRGVQRIPRCSRASADVLGRSPRPPETSTITARRGRPDWDKISALIDQWQPAELVVGLPLHDDGSDSDISKDVRRFVKQLHERYQRPVHTMNERLSTHAAREYMQESPGKQELDAVAAMIILQNWLEQ